MKQKKVVSQSNPLTADGLIEAVERYQAKGNMLNYRTQASSHPQTRRTPKGQPTQLYSQKKENSGPFKQLKALSDCSPRTCYKCGELCHISW